MFYRSRKRRIRNLQDLKKLDSLQTTSLDSLSTLRDTVNLVNFLQANENLEVNLEPIKDNSSELEFDLNIYEIHDVDVLPLLDSESCISKNSKKCFHESLTKQVKKLFFYPEKSLQEQIEGKIFIQYLIDKNANFIVQKVVMRKNHNKDLISAGKKIFSKVTALSAARKDGKAVSMSHYFTLNFSLQN